MSLTTHWPRARLTTLRDERTDNAGSLMLGASLTLLLIYEATCDSALRARSPIRTPLAEMVGSRLTATPAGSCVAGGVGDGRRGACRLARRTLALSVSS